MPTLNHPGAIYQGTGIYMSFRLLAVACLIISTVMLRNDSLSRVTAGVGILASAFDLALRHLRLGASDRCLPLFPPPT